MRYRWTREELERATETEILRSLVVERQSFCTNMYAPLYKRLAEIYSNLSKKIEEEAE